MKSRLVKQHNNSYLPEMDDDYDKMKRIKVGQTVCFDWSVPRNPLFHRKYMALLNIVCQNMSEEKAERYGTTEKLRKDIMYRTGRYDIEERFDGVLNWNAHSISFGSMKEEEFEKLYNEAFDIILKYYIPELTREEYEKNFSGF